MAEGAPAKPPDGSEWPTIVDEERTLYELLFYSQGPVDGYLLGEGVRDLFLKSGLSLRVLSEIWNLADVSNDNVLSVHEFSLAMHLIRGLLKGQPCLQTLPRKLTPPTTTPVPLEAPTAAEREAYVKVFQALDVDKKGFLDADCCRQVFHASGLTSEVLAHVWNLSDVTRDGKLDLEEFCVACRLLRFLKAGSSISGPVDVFKLLPDRIASKSLQARKQRVQQYEQHKQKLMSLKEKRKVQVMQENKRLQLQEDKLGLIRQVHKIQKKAKIAPVTEEEFSKQVALHKEETEQLDEIVYRLKKEHEKVRQDTVKTILAEQKLSNDIVAIKKETNELNRRLATNHTHATKDPDPFHQLYEQRKEKRQGSTIKDLDKIEVALPFSFNPFDPTLDPTALSPGVQVFSANNNNNNNHVSKASADPDVLKAVACFGEGFDALVSASTLSSAGGKEEEDSIFKEVPVSMDRERWLGFQWGSEDDGVLGLSGPETEELQEKLLNLRIELRKLNETGTRLVFTNPDDYTARKQAQQEEEKGDRSSRFNRRSLTERLSGVSDSSPRLRDRGPRDRVSYTERNEEASQAVREYRYKRQSQQSLDSSANSSANSSPKNSRSGPKAPERPSRTKGAASPGSSSDPQASPEADLSSPTSAEASSASVRDGARISGTEAARRGSEALSQTVSDAASPSSSPHAAVGASAVNNKDQVHVALAVNTQAPPTAVKTERSTSQNDNLVQRFDPAKPVEDEQGVSAGKRSSKKSRAPPPPPTASSGQPAQSSRTDRNQAAAPPPKTSTLPAHFTVEVAVPQPKTSPTTQSSAVLVAQDPSSQAHPHSSKSPQRPARPKRRKDSQNGSNSGAPSSPGDVQIQQNELKYKQEVTVKSKEDESLLAGVRSSLSKSFLLTENPSLQAETPEPQGNISTIHKRQQSSNSSSGVQLQVNGTDGAELKHQTGKTPSLPDAARHNVEAARPAITLSQSPSKALSLTAIAKTSVHNEAVEVKQEKGIHNQAVEVKQEKGIHNEAVEVKQEKGIHNEAVEVKQEKGIHNQAVEVKQEKGISLKNKTPPPPQPEPLPRPSQSQPPPQPEQPPPRPEQLSDNQAGSFSVTLDSKPFVAVSAKNKSAASKLLQLSIPDLSPEPVRREFASLDKDRDKDRDSIHSRNSDTSSLCDSDADSLPPPLPFSAPPPLPCSPPPFQAPGGVFSAPEEVIEVRRAGPRLQAAPPRISPQRTPGSKMSDGVALQCGASLPGPLTVDPLPDHALDDQKSTTDLRAEFFSLGSPSNSMTKEGFDLIVLETAKVTQNPTDQASDSDLSSDENVREGTFSLAGDSGVVVSSLPTSPDDTGSNNNEGDNKIELISYSYTASANLTNTTITAIKEERDASATPTNTNSTLTSTKDGCDASATSTTTNTTVTSVKDNRNDVVSDQDSDVITTEFRVSATTGSAPTIQRPQSLSVADPSPPVAQTSPSSPKELAQADAAEVSAMTPRSREIFEKARHFAEMVQKPSFTVKREKAPTAEAAEADFSQEVLQGLEMERRAVISQSTVRRKDVKESLPSPASPTPGSGSAASYAVFTPSPVATAVGSCGDGRIEPEVCEAPPGRQTSQNHFDAPSPERSVSPQAKWSDNTGRLNLYSENVVQEPDSTEVVDRESIANLATTRRQWERIVTVETPQEPAPKKNPSKWQVRVPYAEKAASSPVIVTTDNSAEVASLAPDKSPALNAAAMESNIEREIRLTVEREEMLKREQEERVHSRNKVPSMESSTESELLQPTFHELTEADRGSEFLMNESRVQHEDSMQEESLQKAFHHQKFHTSSKSPDDGTTEGIIDREIRLQREREVELARQRGEIPIHKSTQVQHQVPLQPDPSPHPVKQHAAEPVVEDISYEEALTRHNHEGESRIAQELRELKEREEEMKRLRERMSKAYLGGGDGAERNKSQPASPALAKQQELSSQSQSPLKVAAAPQAPHTVDKTATVSHSVSRNVHASPGLDPTSDASSTPAAQPKNETPMQCEIRLSRERENEFRRSKGLPELPPTESERQENGNVSNNEDAVDSGSHGSGYHRYNSLQPDIGVRHFASNRLQREILEQKQREIKLRQEGHIITTSEEHIQPMRYAEVVGQDHSDTPSRRNFKPPVRRGSATPEEAAMDSSSHAISRDSPGVKKTSGGSASFKYKEFAQTAESRIERELREMREREEELRKQRVSGSAES